MACAVLVMGTAATGVAMAAPEGPWSKAKVGDSIKYRMSDPYALAARTASAAEITETVTAVDASKVTVKTTRREEGKDEQVSTQNYPRSLNPQQIKQFYTGLGQKTGGSVTQTVSGVKLKCDKWVVVQERKQAENTLTGTTVLCQDIPGWMFSQSVKRQRDASDTTWYQLLELKR